MKIHSQLVEKSVLKDKYMHHEIHTEPISYLYFTVEISGNYRESLKMRVRPESDSPDSNSASAPLRK